MNVNEDDCRNARLYFDARLAEDEPECDGGPELRQKIEQHLTECAECLSWQRQTTELAAVASQLPQFDVSEALTQRILNDAAMQQSKKGSIIATVAGVLVALCALGVLQVVDQCESTTGLLSWLVGMVTMVAFAKFVSEPAAAATVVSKGTK
jgi:predicted anti-sigma-YlaC factor YlaD